eukprot:2950712-Prymnesium_polylepis.1
MGYDGPRKLSHVMPACHAIVMWGHVGHGIHASRREDSPSVFASSALPQRSTLLLDTSFVA